jgi:hypothetical protein
VQGAEDYPQCSYSTDASPWFTAPDLAVVGQGARRPMKARSAAEECTFATRRHVTLCNPQRGRGCISCDRWNALPYCAVMAGLSRTSRTGFVSSSSATASRDFTKSENER